MFKAGEVNTLAGNGETGFADGQGEAARFDHPVGVALAETGRTRCEWWTRRCLRLHGMHFVLISVLFFTVSCVFVVQIERESLRGRERERKKEKERWRERQTDTKIV